MSDFSGPAAAPVLSTPDNHIFEQPGLDLQIPASPLQDEEQLNVTYEIQRTVREIRESQWKRIALQFPDHMLPDAPRVFKLLSRGLQNARKEGKKNVVTLSPEEEVPEAEMKKMSIAAEPRDAQQEKLFILADTSYGACCVDEVAAEHAEADVVVHYGRSCLTPTARLPVIYVFTMPPLDLDAVVEAFKSLYDNVDEKVILMADIPYNHHLGPLQERLNGIGYSNTFMATLVHDASSALPNRTTPPESDLLTDWQLFHVSDPPESLLLTLSSRVGSVSIFPTRNKDAKVVQSSSAQALRRRYATITKLTTVPIFGILINTLSVKNYMDILAHVKRRIAEAGKKSYTFVVGKVNAAKVANFSEIGGWVVIGCWESSLFDSRDFWKPIITPFELELALTGDTERVWTGAWSSDFQAVLDSKQTPIGQTQGADVAPDDQDEQDEDEDEPPEFDLRTGQYVSHSRPMGRKPTGPPKEQTGGDSKDSSTSLIKRANRELATIGGEVSPAAEYFKNKRTWKGLGSDFEIQYDEHGTIEETKGAVVEEGRKGIAKGYTVGGEAEAQHK